MVAARYINTAQNKNRILSTDTDWLTSEEGADLDQLVVSFMEDYRLAVEFERRYLEGKSRANAAG